MADNSNGEGKNVNWSGKAHAANDVRWVRGLLLFAVVLVTVTVVHMTVARMRRVAHPLESGLVPTEVAPTLHELRQSMSEEDSEERVEELAPRVTGWSPAEPVDPGTTTSSIGIPSYRRPTSGGATFQVKQNSLVGAPAYGEYSPAGTVSRTVSMTGTPSATYTSSATEEPDMTVSSTLSASATPTPVAFDELWVIKKDDSRAGVRAGRRAPQHSQDDDVPLQGELWGTVPGQSNDAEVALPLDHTDVQANVSGFASTVRVTQLFRNPYDEKIEVRYVFPLPRDSAVTAMEMKVGDRTILGLIREKEEAEAEYRWARSQGYRAALLTQERPNIFTQKVANIEPLHRIDVSISYFSTLSYTKGEFEFVFPMVVGPRYNPANSGGDGVGAVPYGRSGTSGESTEVEYLRPETRSGHDIAVSVHIDAGMSIEHVSCHTHDVDVKTEQSVSEVTVTLRASDSVPNRDFVLRYRVSGDETKAAALVHRGDGDEGGTVAVLVVPPNDAALLPRMPREMVFVVDTSGSMDGWPIEKCKKAMIRCLTNLDPVDTFQIVSFAGYSVVFSPKPVPATEDNIRRGLEFVRGIRADGGTEMLEGIRRGLDFPPDETRLRIITFMTDGFVGNEEAVFAEVRRLLGSSRIFSFGIGDGVNRYLLDGLARVGKGQVAYVGLDEDSARAVDNFYELAARPALTNVAIDWGAIDVSHMYPTVLPDLFSGGRPVLLTARFDSVSSPPGRTTLTVTGRQGNAAVAIPVSIDLAGSEEHAGVPKVWARARIDDLSIDRAEPARAEIIRTSLAYSVLSRYTAFLAVDSEERTAGNTGVSVVQPVPVPHGVKYETTV